MGGPRSAAQAEPERHRRPVGRRAVRRLLAEAPSAPSAPATRVLLLRLCHHYRLSPAAATASTCSSHSPLAWLPPSLNTSPTRSPFRRLGCPSSGWKALWCGEGHRVLPVALTAPRSLRQICFITAKALLGADTEGYKNGLTRILNTTAPGDLTRASSQFTAHPQLSGAVLEARRPEAEQALALGGATARGPLRWRGRAVGVERARDAASGRARSGDLRHVWVHVDRRPGARAPALHARRPLRGSRAVRRAVRRSTCGRFAWASTSSHRPRALGGCVLMRSDAQREKWVL